MSGSSRRRSSKWDLKEESRVPFEDIQDGAWTGKAVIPHHEKESQRGWLSPGANDGNRSKWSTVEPLPRRRGSRRDESMDEEHNRTLKAMTTWDGDENYGTRMSPGLEDWRQQKSHRSPKNEWKRSRRSRSRSRSHSRTWSRSRSRSPVHGFRRESGAYGRSRGRSGISEQICKDFAVGRCRRANNCQFLHADTRNYEDGWERERKTAASNYSVPQDSREYYPIVDDSCRSSRHGMSDVPSKGFTNEIIRERDNDRRHRHESPERRVERGTRRVDVPCKFFATGNCRKGDNCRFTHHSQTQLSPDRRSRDVRCQVGQKSNDMEKLWDGPKWSDANTSSHTAKSSEDRNETIDAPEPRLVIRPTNDRWGQSLDENKAHSNQPTKKVVEIDEKEVLHWRAGSAIDHMHVPEQRASENWLGDMEMSPDWKYRVPPSNLVDRGEHSSLPMREPGITQEPLGQMHDATAVNAPIVNILPSIQQDYNLRGTGVCALSLKDKSLTGKTDSTSISISPSILAAQSFSQNGMMSDPLPLPSINTVGRSEVAIHNDPPRGMGLINVHNQTLFPEGKAIKQDLVDASVPQLKSGVPTAPNRVSSEEITQLTNLSASLAQLLANGHQLPELYVAHNIQNSMNTPSFANTQDHAKLEPAATLQPGQDVGPRKQYDPMCDSFGPEENGASTNPANLLSNLKSTADEKLDVLPKNATSSLGCAPDGVYKVTRLEEVPTDKVHQLNPLETGVNSEVSKESHGVGPEESRKAQGENQTAQENVPPEDFDGDVKVDEGKKSKEAKGIRDFKFALVESVKELLKPTWKEGQMSKDAYKSIVKKVVDKVTGTMQGAHIPQTQEKIDKYLSVSKPKLTKLIQAYVEKFQKDK